MSFPEILLCAIALTVCCYRCVASFKKLEFGWAYWWLFMAVSGGFVIGGSLVASLQ